MARRRAWPVTSLGLLASVMAACAFPRPPTDGIGAGPGLVGIRVDGELTGLAASRDGTLLVATVCAPHGVVVVDPRRPGAERRVAVPVRGRDPEGRETHGYLADVALAEDGATAWACSTEGQVFAIDTASGTIREVRELPGLSVVTIVVDDARRRVIVGTEEGAILALQPDGPREILRLGQPVRGIERSGDLLDVAAGPMGMFFSGVPGGDREATPDQLLTLDLATDRILAEAAPTTGCPSDIARTPDGRLLVAEWLDDRVLEFDGRWEPLGERRLPGFDVRDIEVSGGRVLVASMEDSRILEYGLVEGRMTRDPIAEYVLPTEHGGHVAVLGDASFAVAISTRRGSCLFVVGRSWARPFSGIEEP